MAFTPPPALTSPQTFRLPPLPAFNRPPPRQAGPGGAGAHPFLSGRDSLSASFSLGPDSLLDHLQLAPGTPAASRGVVADQSVAGGSLTLDEYELGANNSSLLPCSPRITTTAARSLHRATKGGNGRRRRPSSMSFGDASGAGSSDLSALQLGRSPAGFQLGAARGAPAGLNGGQQALGTPPVRSRLRFGGGPESLVDLGSDAAHAPIGVDDSSFVRGRSGLGVDLGFLPEGAEEDEEDELESPDEGLIEKVRIWRTDAIMQHLYESAAFWADKLLSWTGDKYDAFWLAQIHFLTGHYSRALRLLLSPLRSSQPPSASDKGKARADDSDLLYSSDEEEEMGAMGYGGGDWAQGLGRAEHKPADDESGRRLIDTNLACRHLAAQCQVRMGLFQDALETLGNSNPFAHLATSGARIKSDGGFKLEASMCFLRGTIYLQINRTERAKVEFMEALALDVRSYDAFLALVGGEMMSVDEEWDFIQGLCYKEQTDECAEFIRMVYTVRLKKFKHLREITLARKRLEREYAMGDNADVLFGRADALYAQYRWAECYAVTTRILSAHPSHSSTLPLHLACMHHLPRLRSSLFLLAHTLVDSAPDEATSWYAVGLWYFTGERWDDARRYFGKASLMDPRFGASWIAFAHSFAMEKEHDQAIPAYSTAARLFQGSHLPMLYIGMEHLQLQNIEIASNHFESALKTCQTDPLLFNEMGVVSYSRGDFGQAADEFARALEAAEDMQGSAIIWAPTHLNLAHALRKTHRYDEALESYTRALQLHPVCDSAYAGRGMVYQTQGRWNEAIECYHEALSLNPQSAHVTPLLNLALQASIDLLGPIKAISSLPSFQAPQASWSQQQQSNGSRAGDRSTADDDPSRSYSQSFAAAGQHSSTMHGGGMTEDGSTMEIEDSMM